MTERQPRGDWASYTSLHTVRDHGKTGIDRFAGSVVGACRSAMGQLFVKLLAAVIFCGVSAWSAALAQTRPDHAANLSQANRIAHHEANVTAPPPFAHNSQRPDPTQRGEKGYDFAS